MSFLDFWKRRISIHPCDRLATRPGCTLPGTCSPPPDPDKDKRKVMAGSSIPGCKLLYVLKFCSKHMILFIWNAEAMDCFWHWVQRQHIKEFHTNTFMFIFHLFFLRHIKIYITLQIMAKYSKEWKIELLISVIETLAKWQWKQMLWICVTLTRCCSLSNQRLSCGLFRQRFSFAHLCHCDQDKASVRRSFHLKRITLACSIQILITHNLTVTELQLFIFWDIWI